MSERPVWLAICGGLVFAAIFVWRYAGIDPEFYQFRDDGVITLSHARNWIDFGFIGVNPSGERIEAYSAPLQMLVYALAYGITGLDFTTFMSLQTALSTFALGWLFASFFADRPVFALLACAVAALVLTRLSSFIVWHGSGMENALTHALLLWTVWVLYRFARDARVDTRWVLVPFLASISRVEAIFHVAPLLLVFCIYWQGKERDGQARRFAAVFAMLWMLFNLSRYFYFGSLLPNTAVAQGISVGERIIELLTLSPIYLDQSFALARTIFSMHGGYLLILLVPFVVFRRRADLLALLLAMAACLVLTALFTPFVFGAARLDTTRTTTQMAIAVVLAIAGAVHHWKPRRIDAYLVPISAALVFLIHEYTGSSPYKVCCSVKGFDQVRLAFAGIAAREGIPRPTVANPDLGVISWHKQFNVLDVGLLGSPLVARLQGSIAFNEYFFDYAAPDMIETHGWWTCKYKDLLADRRFAASYVPADGAAPSTTTCQGAAVPTGIWVRRDVLRSASGRERAFIDALANDPTAQRIEAELRGCRASAVGSPAACAYVARSAYRHLPELRARGESARLQAVFRESPSADFDLYLLNGAEDARAFAKALARFERQP